MSRPLTSDPHAEAIDLAPQYVLGALEREDEARVRAHLATCARPHPEFAELGSVVPALAELIEPVPAPAALRERVSRAVHEDAATHRPVAGVRAPAVRRLQSLRTDDRRRRGARGWMRLALPLAAAIVAAALGGWNLLLQGELGEARRRAADAELRAAEAERARDATVGRVALLAGAVAALNAPGASVARMAGTDAAPGVSGFAALPRDSEGYLVVVGLPPAPEGKGYQAWYITEVAISSAGILEVQGTAPAVLPGLRRETGIERMTVTVEAATGADRPTTDPLVAGSFGS